MNHHANPLEGFSPVVPGGRAVHDYAGWFRRWCWVLVLCLLGGISLGSYIYRQTPATFQSSATIEILRVKKEAADVTEGEKIRMNGVAEMLSAAEKLRMPSLYERVAAGHLFAHREDVVSRTLRYPWEPEDIPTREQIGDEWLGGMMRGWVSVQWREETNLIDIRATHSDPEVARDTLVGLLAEYERATDEKLAGSSDYALDYILESSTEIKNELLRLERALQSYESCQNLSDEIRASERRIDEMEKRYLEKWPPLVEAKQHRAILRERFSRELAQVVLLSEGESGFWGEKEELMQQLEEEERVDSQIQLVTTRARVLERELEAEQQIYDNLITKLKEGNVTKGFASKHFDIVQPPGLSAAPIGPNRKKIVSKYAFAGGALGVALIFGLGFLDQRIRSVNEMEKIVENPILASVPASKEPKPANHLVIGPGEDMRWSEAIRGLRASLGLVGQEKRCKSFLITSSVAMEGKSYIAGHLALAFAKQGKRTLLIDADLRLPTQHDHFGYDERRPGLADHLALRTPLKELVIRSEESPKLRILPAGSRSANPAELLAGENFPLLLKNIEKYFDCIVIDSAPLVPVSDTIPLMRQAESVILVSRIGMTPRTALRRAMRLLRGNDSNLVGVVANGVPVPKLLFGYDYSYGASSPYSKRLDQVKNRVRRAWEVSRGGKRNGR